VWYAVYSEPINELVSDPLMDMARIWLDKATPPLDVEVVFSSP